MFVNLFIPVRKFILFLQTFFIFILRLITLKPDALDVIILFFKDVKFCITIILSFFIALIVKFRIITILSLLTALIATGIYKITKVEGLVSYENLITYENLIITLVIVAIFTHMALMAFVVYSILFMIKQKNFEDQRRMHLEDTVREDMTKILKSFFVILEKQDDYSSRVLSVLAKRPPIQQFEGEISVDGSNNMVGMSDKSAMPAML